MIRSNLGIDLGDDLHEFFVVNGSVSVLIGVVDHLVDLAAGEVLAHAGGHILELLRAEGAGAGGVEGLEDGLEGGLVVGISSEAEDVEEGGEVDVSLVPCVVDDGEDLRGLSLEVERPDGVDELLSGDVAAAVVVEDVEDLLELADSVGIEALLDVFAGIKTFGWGWSLSFGHKIFLI